MEQILSLECRFINTISQTGHTEAPPDLHGGIFADPMGLGKSLTMIALIAKDFETCSIAPAEQAWDESVRPDILTSLIIVPPSRKYILEAVSVDLLLTHIV
jgi:hypothetical protein